MPLKSPMSHAVLLLAILLPFSATADSASTTQVFIDNGELHYVGSVSADANQRVIALFEQAQKKPSILSVRSKGGPTEAGMDLGRWVHAQGLKVKVMEYCFSSCANYVFTAAKEKIVSNLAVVGYHGGLSSTSFQLGEEEERMLKNLPAAQRQEVRAKLEQTIRQSLAPQEAAERAFFALIGVQQRITTLGQARQELHKDDKSIGWTYSTASFAKLGVQNIRVINPPWLPTFTNTDAFVTLMDVN